MAQPALADQTSGNDVCMGTLFTAKTGGKLNCTSQDVKIAEATDVSPATCEKDTLFNLTATFKVVLSGGGSNQTRYDLGLYFDTLGDPEHDGARTGTCTLTVIEPGDTGYVPLDTQAQPTDICGDINTANNPLFPEITLQVLCTDTDGDGFLNLPNCTSWRQPGANGICDEATDAFPGTSSKCNCADTFNVPVTVTPAKASLKKNPKQALVTYTVDVKNEGAHAANLTALSDDTYGNIADSSNAALDSTTCVVPQNNLAVNATYSCEFTVLVSAPGSSTPVTDIVTGTLVDTVNGTTASPVGTATVTIDLPQTP